MRTTIVTAFLLLIVSFSLHAQTADEIITKYIKSIGGMKKIQSIKTVVRSGKYIGGGGFEAVMRQENKRPNSVREEFSLQGMTGVNAYDGTTGWKIEPWSGKKDAESLGEEELKSIIEDADFDGPLVEYKKKGNTVKYIGLEPVEGTDALKIEIVRPSGDIYYYYMDTDYYVPIKIDIKRFVRGEEREYELTLGDYKEVSGVYFPFSVETNVKGSPDRAKVVFDKIEANVPIPDDRFTKPAVPAKPQEGK